VDNAVQNFAVANLRRRPSVVETGGFVAGFDPGTTSAYINYATPLPDAEPTDQDVAALVTAFRERGLKPRLEFAPGAAPAVEPALREAGFTVEAVHEYLVCTPETLSPTPSIVKVETPVSDEDYAALDAALSEAFGGEFAPSSHGATRLRRTQQNGGAVRLVRTEDGGCAGGGSSSAAALGISELAGVGTRPTHRGRGTATAITAALTEAMFGQGAHTVWLEYSGDGSRRVYERVGFAPRGTRLYMIME
jgi:RimJ/RimL family protein N-acetyltransferase